MKKTILSGSLILIFILYGLHQRQEDKAAQVIPQTLIIAAEPSPTTTPTPASSADPVATFSATPTASPVKTAHQIYRYGTYTGSVADAIYGNVQVEAKISNGKIIAVNFLQSPGGRQTSIRINSEAIPYLQKEAIQAQSAQVDGVSGASDTSQAFIQSLSVALNQAKSNA